MRLPTCIWRNYESFSITPINYFDYKNKPILTVDNDMSTNVCVNTVI